MLSKLFSFKDFDGHYTFRLFGIKLSFKHKCKFKYVPATEYGVTREKRTPQVIVSLTSFPARINTTHLAINTILRQTFKPDRVILWLADEQFPNKENDLPNEIIKLKDLGLEIKWCEDIKSYKKLIPALKEFPNDIIVTADDDIYYPVDWLESLYNSYKAFPDCVNVQRAMRLTFKDNKIIYLGSNAAQELNYDNPSYFNQQLGGTGGLYPPNILNKEIFNMKLLNILPTSDDVAFWAMAVLNRKRIKVVNKNWSINSIDGLRESSLSLQNRNYTPNKSNKEVLMEEYSLLNEIIKEEYV